MAAMQTDAAAAAAAGPAVVPADAAAAQVSANGVVQANSLAVLLTQVCLHDPSRRPHLANSWFTMYEMVLFNCEQRSEGFSKTRIRTI